jgi:hypothetical protein
VFLLIGVSSRIVGLLSGSYIVLRQKCVRRHVVMQQRVHNGDAGHPVVSVDFFTVPTIRFQVLYPAKRSMTVLTPIFARVLNSS